MRMGTEIKQRLLSSLQTLGSVYNMAGWATPEAGAEPYQPHPNTPSTPAEAEQQTEALDVKVGAGESEGETAENGARLGPRTFDVDIREDALWLFSGSSVLRDS